MLLNVNICIIGIGGFGIVVVISFCVSGVGLFMFIDYDMVEVINFLR